MAISAIDLLTGNRYLFSGVFTGSTITIVTGVTGITTANNGLSIVGLNQVKLGGTLICTTTITDGRIASGRTGIEYGGNYSASFTNRSLIDKEYVDNKVSGNTPSWAVITLKPQWLSGTTLQSFQTGHTHTDIINNIDYISGITNTKLNTSKFLVYTGDTNFQLTHLESYGGNGVLSGFTITQHPPTSACTTIDISVGEGFIVNNYTNYLNPQIHFVHFSGVTAFPLTYLNTNLVTYLAIDSGGTIQQQTSYFTNEQRRDLIIIGAVIHSNKIYINAVNNLPDVALDSNSQFNDLLDGLKNFNIEGNVITYNGVNLYLNKSEGKIFKKGANFVNSNKNPHKLTTTALIAPTTIRYRLSNGTEYNTAYTIIGAAYTASTTNDYIIDVTGGTFTLMLPTAVGKRGKQYIIKNSNTGVLTIACYGAQTIDGITTATISTQYQSIRIVSDGNNWKKI
ncbi:MAG: hypothetical protein WC428_00455 [Candidatus Paceibacterota bacterium]